VSHFFYGGLKWQISHQFAQTVLVHLCKGYNLSRLQGRVFPDKVARMIRTWGILPGNDAWPFGLCCMRTSPGLCPGAQRGVGPPFCWSLELKSHMWNAQVIGFLNTHLNRTSQDWYTSFIYIQPLKVTSFDSFYFLNTCY